jgi:hypothetical protein
MISIETLKKLILTKTYSQFHKQPLLSTETSKAQKWLYTRLTTWLIQWLVDGCPLSCDREQQSSRAITSTIEISSTITVP